MGIIMTKSNGTGGLAVAAELSKEDEVPAIPHTSDDARTQWGTPGFGRMSIEWKKEDRVVIDRSLSAVQGLILRNFSEIWEIINEVYDIVRTPVVDDNGEPVRDVFGYVQWKRNETGGYEEDFTKLSTRNKEALMFKLVTGLFRWQMQATDVWGEAMLAKTQWEERFSAGFEAPMTGTEADRTAAGKLAAIDERYHAVLLSMYSRKADALIRSAETLQTRLKDSLQSH